MRVIWMLLIGWLCLDGIKGIFVQQVGLNRVRVGMELIIGNDTKINIRRDLWRLNESLSRGWEYRTDIWNESMILLEDLEKLERIQQDLLGVSGDHWVNHNWTIETRDIENNIMGMERERMEQRSAIDQVTLLVLGAMQTQNDIVEKIKKLESKYLCCRKWNLTYGQEGNISLYYHRSVIWNGSIYTYGGWDPTKPRYNLWKLDPQSPSPEFIDLTPEIPPPRERYGHSANLWKNHLIIYGGSTTRSSFKGKDIWRVDLNASELFWEELTPPDGSLEPHQRAYHTASMTGNGLLTIFGGKWGSQEFNDVWQFDLNETIWHNISLQDDVAQPISRYGASSVWHSNRFIILGGVAGDTKKNDMWMIQFKPPPGNSSWTEIQQTGSTFAHSYFSVLLSYGYKIIHHGISDPHVRIMDLSETHILKNSFEWYHVESNATLGRYRHSGVIWNDGLVIIGGMCKQYVGVDAMFYSFSKNIWSSIISYPAPFPRRRHVMEYYNGTIYAYGGYSGMYHGDLLTFRLNIDTSWNISLAERTYSADIDPGKRFQMCSTVFYSSMIIFGGRTNTNQNMNDVWELEFQAFRWKELVPNAPEKDPMPRSYIDCSIYEDRFLWFYGGISDDAFSDMWSLDLKNVQTGFQNRTIPEMPSRYHHCQECWNNHLVIEGGYPQGDILTVEFQDSSNLQFSVPSIPDPKPDLSGDHACTLYKHYLVVLGISMSDNPTYYDVYGFDLEKMKWFTLTPPNGPYPISRSQHAMASMENGIMVYGGYQTTTLESLWILSME
jgi:hypothetical protein